MAHGSAMITMKSVEIREKEIVLENAQVKIAFSTKGGGVKYADIKGFLRQEPILGKAGGFTKSPAVLMNNPLNTFNYALPLTTGIVNTSDLYFKAVQNGKTVTFRADAGEGGPG